MEDKINEVREKLTSFWRTSFGYIEKEITLESNQHFSIDQLCNDENLQKGIYNYQIQYGFPQSFSFNEKSKSFSIDKATVYAPASDKEFIIANFAPQTDLGGLNVSANVGLDMDTKEHTSSAEIAQNPNALNMLAFAIGDLEKAEVLGECRLAVPAGSERIPLCHSTNKSLNKGKR